MILKSVASCISSGLENYYPKILLLVSLQFSVSLFSSLLPLSSPFPPFPFFLPPTFVPTLPWDFNYTYLDIFTMFHMALFFIMCAVVWVLSADLSVHWFYLQLCLRYCSVISVWWLLNFSYCISGLEFSFDQILFESSLVDSSSLLKFSILSINFLNI